MRASTGVTWRLRLAREGVFRFNLAALGTEFDPSPDQQRRRRDAGGRARRRDGPRQRRRRACPTSTSRPSGLDPAVNDAAQPTPTATACRTWTNTRLARTRAGGSRGYFAEGASGDFFGTRFALLQPARTPRPPRVVLRPQFEDGTTQSVAKLAASPGPPHDRCARTDRRRDAVLRGRRSSPSLMVVDRLTMRWDRRGYGTHAESARAPRPATHWYLAEGATHGGMHLFYLVQNPGDRAAEIEVATPAPAAGGTACSATRSRRAVAAHHLGEPDRRPRWHRLSATVRSTNGVPVVVERAMYLIVPGSPSRLGMRRRASPHPSRRGCWPKAPLATSSTSTSSWPTRATRRRGSPSTYALPGRRHRHAHHVVAPRSRYTILVDPRIRGWRPRPCRPASGDQRRARGRRARDVVAGADSGDAGTRRTCRPVRRRRRCAGPWPKARLAGRNGTHLPACGQHRVDHGRQRPRDGGHRTGRGPVAHFDAGR